MSKGLVVQGLIGAVLTLLTFGLTHWLLSPFPGISEANCDRIRPGMTLQQVEAILGGPPTYRYSFIVDDRGKMEFVMLWYSGGRREVHETGERIAEVGFTPGGRVTSVRLEICGIGPAHWRWCYAAPSQ
jgi:hypothetical protein